MREAAQYIKPPTERQKRFADAISKALGVYPANETFQDYRDFISEYKNEFYNLKQGRNR